MSLSIKDNQLEADIETSFRNYDENGYYQIIGYTPGQIQFPKGDNWYFTIKLCNCHVDKLIACADRFPKIFVVNEGLTLEGFRKLSSITNICAFESSEPPTLDSLDILKDWRSLTELSLFFKRDIAEPMAKAIGSLTKLEKLNLQGSYGLKDEQLTYLSQLRQLSNLGIELNTNITDEGVRQLANLNKLRRLSLRGCERISNKSTPYLIGLPNLTILDISGTDISDDGMKEICKIQSLQRLYIQKTKITDSSYHLLHNLINLKYVDIAESLSFRDDFRNSELMHHTTFVTLRHRGLNDNHLRNLANIHTLRDIDLCGNSAITDQGLLYLKGLPHLVRLNLSQCPEITDRGLDFLKDMPVLENLILKGKPYVTDEGIKALCSNKALRKLDLRACSNLTDKSLVELSTLPKLEYLLVRGCPLMTEYGLNLVRKTHPKITLHWSERCCHMDMRDHF